MQYLRCKCGARQMYSSMGASDCDGCDKCNTTLATHPQYHGEIKPHTMITKYDQDTGKPYQICKFCSKVEKEQNNTTE